jgi:hypothetical protein
MWYVSSLICSMSVFRATQWKAKTHAGEMYDLRVQWPGLSSETWGSRVSYSQHAISISRDLVTFILGSLLLHYGQGSCIVSCKYTSGMM